MTIFETIRRLLRAFARALPEYEKRNLREWRYWGTIRAKRELRSFGLEWKELTPPGEGADEKRSANGRAKVLREAHGGSHRTVKE
jgi:hypothetical protein